MHSELHLFIIWNNARNIEKQILEDISTDLKIIKTIEVHWSRRFFVKNLVRFYGTKLHRWSFKDRECGNAPFLLVIVEDSNPKYEERKTSRGKMELVNSKMFDKKTKYRNWLGGNNSKVHCTNNINETRHDLMLLLGLTIDDFYKNFNNLPSIIKEDIVGNNGWESLEQIFKVLNETTEYLVLRNFEYLPNHFKSIEHGDIDLLVKNQKEVAYILNAKKISKKEYRVNYKCMIGNNKILFDLRYVGDNYYDYNWQETMLKNRILNEKGIFVLDKTNYKFSLLYHALIHKKIIADDYILKLKSFFNKKDLKQELFNYLNNNNYEISYPKDLSVYFNAINANKEIDKKRKSYFKRMNLKKKIYSLIKIR